MKLECAWSYRPAVRVKGQPKSSHTGHFLEEGFTWGSQVAKRNAPATITRILSELKCQKSRAI